MTTDRPERPHGSFPRAACRAARRSAPIALFLCAGAVSCIGPLDDDEFGFSGLVLAPETLADPATSDSGLVRGIDDADQVPSTLIPLRLGFAQDAEVRYWDLGVWFGVAPPLWSLHRCGADGRPLDGAAGEVAHPLVVDSVPGNFDYTPFRFLQTVCVTAAYSGERLPSLRALTEARMIGLVEEPTRSGTVIDLAVVAPRAQLDVGGDPPRVIPPAAAYYRGQAVAYHRFAGAAGALTLPPPGNFVPPARVYELTTTDGLPLPPVFSVPRRNGAVPHPAYTGLWLVVAVRLAPGVDAEDARSEAALFAVEGPQLTPTSRVAAYEVGLTTVVRELQWAAGAP